MSENYKSPPEGNNMSWVFWHFDPSFFSDPSKLEAILREGLKEDGLTPLEWHTHKFDCEGGGYTMLVPLSESHLSIHTYKEYGSIAGGLYSCLGPESGMATYRKMLAKVNPKRTVLVRHEMPVDIHYLNGLDIKVTKS